VYVGITVGDEFAESGAGEGVSVSVGGVVGMRVSVGRTGAFVGITACVSATIVNAAVTTADCISCGLTVGSADGAMHALTIMASAVINDTLAKHFILIYLSPE
jgi:hypothetical protein